MRCTLCQHAAVSLNPPLCKEHFVAAFEKRVTTFIRDEQLLSHEDHVCVAASGGKDSLTLLNIVAQQYTVTALLVDEGIRGYREHSRRKLEQFCAQRRIPLVVVEFSKAVGKPLDALQQSYHPCSVCGTLRRHLLELHARQLGCTVIATGHNADDEAQTVLLNLARANTELFVRGGPRTESAEGFLPRVKPLFFLSEKEVMTYALLSGLTTDFAECPYALRGARTTIREALNNYERVCPGARHRILTNYLSIMKKIKLPSVKLPPCSRCGKPASQHASGLCRACRFIAEIRAT